MDTKKIAVATNDKIAIADHLGRADYFAIYTISADAILEKEIIENKFTHHKLHQISEHEKHEHGTGHHSHRELIQALTGCQIVLARGIGDKMVEDLKKAGMRGYVVVEPGSMEEIIKKYIEGELLINRDGGCGCGH